MNERDAVKFGNTIIEYTVVRSPRRKKTVSITLHHSAGVLVTTPLRTPAAEIRQIVLKRADWIIRKAAEAVPPPPSKEFVSGESLPYLGRDVPLFVEPTNTRRLSVALAHGALHITVPAHLEGEPRRTAIHALVVAWYKQRALGDLQGRTTQWARLAGYAPTRVLVRDQRSRWGSCSADGTLRFSWRLIMAPPALIDYLVVHELAHLRVKNHSPAFWAEVRRLMPDWQSRRAQLRELGPRLTF